MSNEKEIINEDQNCLNCNQQLSEADLFCGNCGQAKKESKLSVWSILGDAFQNLFNLDGRFFNTLRHLHQPSKLTKAYIAGKRRSYMNPGKLFIFSLIAFISVLAIDIKLDDVSIISETLIEDVELAKQKVLYDSIVSDLGKSADPLFIAVRDSLYGELNIDSMHLGDSGFLSIFGFDIRDYKITKRDALNLDNDELFEKYEVEKFGDRLFIKQYIKAITNPSGGISYIMKNLTWVILIVIFLMAIIMKLFYIRKNYFYVEHLILLMYNHALLFLVSAISLLAVHYTNGLEMIMSLIPLGLLIVQYLSLRKYYNQGRLKTLIKMGMINTAYLIIAFIIMIFGVVVSFFIF